MMLQIGMEQMEEFISVPGAVTVRPGDARDGELEVEVGGVEGAVDIPLMLYCDDGSEAFEGNAVELQSSLDDFSLLTCMFRLTFKVSSVAVRGPCCLEAEIYTVYGVGMRGEIEVVTVRTIVEDVAGAHLLGSDIRARFLWGGGGGGRRYQAVGAMVGWVMGGGFSVEEVKRLIQSVVVPKVTFGVCLSGVTPYVLTKSDRVGCMVGWKVGLDVTCAKSIVYGKEVHGGMGFVTFTVYTLSAGVREFNVVYVGARIVGRKLFLKEVMWRRMVGWASYHHVRSDESMVVTLFELMATYGIQVRLEDVRVR